MWLKLRQIALVARQLAPAEAALSEVLGVAVCYRDPGVAHFGLENALFPIGNQLLEVVAPTREGTAAGRYLERRGGDGGYMVITQCDDHAPRRARVDALGVRLAHEFTTKGFVNMQMHPKDTGGTFFEIDQQLGANANADDGPWEPRGRTGKRRVDWSACAASPLPRFNVTTRRGLRSGGPRLRRSRSRTPRNSRYRLPTPISALCLAPMVARGLGGIDVITADKAAIFAAAKTRGVKRKDNQLHLCGMRVNLL
ncbi:MAG: hypothetical protein HC809_00075 [Gammaproteobacteria bacterium]|nr:hypothetical protein [Gammaproteobacteria bacterium]